MIRNTGAEALVRNRDVSRCEMAVAFLLCVYADNQGVVVASLDDIAGKLDYGRSVVWDALTSLCDRGFIAKGRKRGMWVVQGELCEPADPTARSYMASAS